MEPARIGIIPRTPLHDELLRNLRSMILRGTLPPGSRIGERALCERFGVSRTPLREAFKVLAASGLVELLPNRGAWVAPLRGVDVANCFQVVALLEVGAAELAGARLTDGVIAELRRQHNTMVLHLRLGDVEQAVKLDLEMHRTLVEAAGNSQLACTHAELALQVERARYLASLSDERMRQSVGEHEAILAAAQTRDPSALADTIRHHCAMTGIALVRAVECRTMAHANAE